MKIIQNNMENNFKREEQVEVFDPVKFLLKYLKFWPYIFISVLVALTIAYFINKSTPPVYQASGKFYINEQVGNNGILDLTGLSRSGFSGIDQKMANQAVFLKSRSVASKALERLDFNVDYFEPGIFTDIELYKSSPIYVQVDWEHVQLTGGRIKITWTDTDNFKISFPNEIYNTFLQGSPSEELVLDQEEYPGIFTFGEFVELPFLKIKVSLVKNLNEGEILINLNHKGSLVSKYTSDIFQVFPYDNVASVLGLIINTTHPQKGVDYLNSLMEVYLELELEEKNRMARNTVEFIDRQISGVSDSLSFFETNLESFRSGNKTYNINVESNTVYEQMTRLEGELSQERFNRDYFENLRNYLIRENYDQIIAPSALGIEDSNLNSLINSLISLQQERSNLLFTQTEESPRVKEISRKIQDTNRSLSEVLSSLSKNTQFKINDLEGRMKKLESEFSRLPSTEQDLIKLERGRDLNETIFTFLQQRRAEAAISMASTSSSNKIVEYAIASYTPIRVREKFTFIVFFGLGFIIPVVIIGAFVLMDKRIKDIKELEDQLNMPLLGKIPQNNAQNSLSVISEPRSALAESFRAIKTNISFVVPVERQLTIAVSSTLSGEGKTFTAINLASIYSLNKKKTLLISCDMFKPSSFREFELKGKVGLSNYLSQQTDSIFEIIQSTKFPLFDIITAGAIPPNPSDLLASERFVELLADLKSVYDVIVLDTPPVGLISQSFEVIKYVDMIAYVLRYKFSENSFIGELNDIKLKKGINNIYAILNDVPAKELTYKGFDYGYYQESRAKKSFFRNLFGRDKAAL